MINSEYLMLNDELKNARFPEVLRIQLSKAEKTELVTNCDRVGPGSSEVFGSGGCMRGICCALLRSQDTTSTKWMFIG
jgi:hypothetical protein